MRRFARDTTHEVLSQVPTDEILMQLQALHSPGYWVGKEIPWWGREIHNRVMPGGSAIHVNWVESEMMRYLLDIAYEKR